LPGLRFPGKVPGFRSRRQDERYERDGRRRRRYFNPLWIFLWLILLIIVLGLLFGGYRKGSKINNPGSSLTVRSAAIADYHYPSVLVG
jgi:hypothetical protein